MGKSTKKEPVRIQIYPSISGLHTVYSALLENPPRGFSFIGVDDSKKRGLIRKIKRIGVLRKIYRGLLRLTGTTRFLSFYNRAETMQESELVLAVNCVYEGDKPWILDIVDSPYSITGGNYQLFLSNIDKISSYLKKETCKSIICPHETCFKIMKTYFPESIHHKLVLIRQSVAIPAEREIRKRTKYSGKKARLLFMGSINNPDDFYIKGGLEAINVAKEISKKYKIKLTIRSVVPERAKKLLDGTEEFIEVIEKDLTRKELTTLYSSSDILLMPAHQYPLMAFLESMAYGLPIVTLDTFAVKDYVLNGTTGFVIKKSEKIEGYNDPAYPTIIRDKNFIDDLFEFDRELINRVAQKTERLILNKNLRIKMGLSGRKRAISLFSPEKRNDKLRKVFLYALR